MTAGHESKLKAPDSRSFSRSRNKKNKSETINCNIVGDSKEGTSPSFRSLCFPKLQIFVEMFAQIYGNREGSTKWRMEKSDLCHRRYRLQNSRYLAAYFLCHVCSEDGTVRSPGMT